jgi:hypothetical protein
LNWWLLANRIEPGNQLVWLENELKNIEKNGGFA